MAPGGDEGAVPQLLGECPEIARILALHRVPVVGFGVHQVAKDAVGDELFDGFELRIPTQYERGYALDITLGDRAVDVFDTLPRECDRLFDDHMPSGSRRTHDV